MARETYIMSKNCLTLLIYRLYTGCIHSCRAQLQVSIAVQASHRDGFFSGPMSSRGGLGCQCVPPWRAHSKQRGMGTGAHLEGCTCWWGVWTGVSHLCSCRARAGRYEGPRGGWGVGGIKKRRRQLASMTRTPVWWKLEKSAGGPWWLCWPLVSSVGKAAGVLCREVHWGPQLLQPRDRCWCYLLSSLLLPVFVCLSFACFLGGGEGGRGPKRVSQAAPQKPGGARPLLHFLFPSAGGSGCRDSAGASPGWCGGWGDAGWVKLFFFLFFVRLFSSFLFHRVAWFSYMDSGCLPELRLFVG